ncbi:MAG: hypothetical protein LBI53_00485 [Candidatus Peribacteria bacterium]|jgi:hypothetical protein|nr:hypothetical protein [Candidatus Peribacteria bacterium]
MITNKVSEETFGKDLLDLRKKYQNLFNRAVQKLKLNYFNNNFPQATNLSNKITYKYTLEEVRNLLSQNIYKTPRYSIDEETTREVSLSPTISVLLYELSTTYTTFEIECETNCLFIDMNKIIYRDNLSQAIISFTGRRTDDFLGVEFE